MTLTRELRTSIAFMVAIVLALTAFVWGNQRLVHADSLAEDILCWIDTTDGIHPPVPFFFEEDCNSGGPVVPPPPQCFDGVDNDNDGKTDWSPMMGQGDPGCDTPTDNDESDDPTPPAQCDDGIDNDQDGKVDMEDPGCTGESDNDETDPAAAPACSDGIDNDGDGKIDFPADPGCSSASDTDETDGGGNGGTPACSDGQDNDGDSKTDFPADPGCTDANDTDETDSTGGGGGSPQCSDGQDNDGDGQIDFPADDDCTDGNDDNESDEGGSGGGGGGSHRNRGGSSSNTNQGEVLGATAECPMYLTGYIKYGANNDAGEVAKLQVFLNNFEGNALPVTGTYGPATLAAVNAFQNKYAADILTPWGARGATGYVYYTTQKQINAIYCKFEKDFPLSAAQIEEIAYVRQIQPQLRAQGITSMGTSRSTAASAAAPAQTAAVGSVVSPNIKVDQNSGIVDPKTQTATAANATSTGSGQGWFTRFINWLFGR